MGRRWRRRWQAGMGVEVGMIVGLVLGMARVGVGPTSVFASPSGSPGLQGAPLGSNGVKGVEMGSVLVLGGLVLGVGGWVVSWLVWD